MTYKEEFFFGLLQVAHRVLRDVTPPQGKADATFLFGEMPENQDGVLAKAAQLIAEGCVGSLYLSELHGRGFPPHALLWKDELAKRGVPKDSIICIVGDFLENPSTYSEVQFLMHQRPNAWRTLYIIAEPFHQLRAFCTLASEIITTGTDLWVYNATPNQSDWLEPVTHSNGRTKDIRAGMIVHELERIWKYHDEGRGNILHPSCLVEYLNERDRTRQQARQ